MSADYYRQCANAEVSRWLQTHVSNALTASQVWEAVNVAMDRFEDELTLNTEAFAGYAIMLGPVPMLCVRTKRAARQQRRLLRRHLGEGRYRIVKTQIARD